MTRRSAQLIASMVLVGVGLSAHCFSQVAKGTPTQERKAGKTVVINWGDKALADTLARNTVAGARITASPSTSRANSAIIAVLRQKEAAAEYTGTTRTDSLIGSAPGDAPGGGTPNPGPAPRGMLGGNSAMTPGDAPGGGTPNPGPAPRGMLRGNSEAAPGDAPGGGTPNPGPVPRGTLLRSTTMSPSGTGAIGPAHTEAASGGGAPRRTPTATKSNIQPGASRQQPPSQNQPLPNQIGKASPPQTVICLNAGIGTVDNAKSGIVFSPGYLYKIKGCGFGTTPGQIYLTGIRNQNISNGGISQAPSPVHSDWVKLQPVSGKWSDSYIEAVVDPATSGFYDSPNATLRIITSDNRTLWNPGFPFFAVRATQTLASIPQGLRIYSPMGKAQQALGGAISFSPAQVTDAAGHAVTANFLSPSAASVVLPGHTFAVVRDDNAASFPAAMDVLDLTSAIEPNGFEISGVQPFYANLTPQACPSKFSSSGSWNVLLTGIDKVNISWQEQSCSINGVSAYAMDVTVTGPKGVSPF